jgi:hypothetical protein
MSIVFWTNFKTNFKAYFVKKFTISAAEQLEGPLKNFKKNTSKQINATVDA